MILHTTSGENETVRKWIFSIRRNGQTDRPDRYFCFQGLDFQQRGHRAKEKLNKTIAARNKCHWGQSNRKLGGPDFAPHCPLWLSLQHLTLYSKPNRNDSWVQTPKLYCEQPQNKTKQELPSRKGKMNSCLHFGSLEDPIGEAGPEMPM